MCKIHHNYFKKQVVVQVVVLYVIYNISMVKYIEAMTMISIIYAKWLWLVKISGCGRVFGVFWGELEKIVWMARRQTLFNFYFRKMQGKILVELR